MIPLPGALIAGGAILKGIGAHQKKKAAESMKGPDVGAIRAELSPWKSKIAKLEQQGANINSQANQVAGQAQGLMQQATGMADPRGEYQQSQTQLLNERLSDQAANVANTQSQLMAQRGMGGGGLAGLLQATSGAQAGEQLRQGMAGIQDAGFQRSMAMRGQGMQMQGQSINMRGQANTLMNQAMNAQQAYSENIVRAQEASRQFDNQRKMAMGQATSDMFGAAGEAALGMGTGALKSYDWSSLFKTKE